MEWNGKVVFKAVLGGYLKKKCDISVNCQKYVFILLKYETLKRKWKRNLAEKLQKELSAYKIIKYAAGSKLLSKYRGAFKRVNFIPR